MKKVQVCIETSVWSLALAEDVPESRADTEAFFERFNAIALLAGYHHQLRIVSPKELIYYDEAP